VHEESWVAQRCGGLRREPVYAGQFRPDGGGGKAIGSLRMAACGRCDLLARTAVEVADFWGHLPRLWGGATALGSNRAPTHRPPISGRAGGVDTWAPGRRAEAAGSLEGSKRPIEGASSRSRTGEALPGRVMGADRRGLLRAGSERSAAPLRAGNSRYLFSAWLAAED